jgi:hypothetical protein
MIALAEFDLILEHVPWLSALVASQEIGQGAPLENNLQGLIRFSTPSISSDGPPFADRFFLRCMG